MKKKSLSALFQPVELTQGECWKTILAFSFPIIVSYLLQQVYTISDAAIVGQTLTAQEVAGVNDTSSLIFIFLQFAFGVSAGFCVVTSCNVGAHNPAGVRRSLTTQIVLSAALTVILTVLALLLLDPMLAWINVTPDNGEVYRAAYTYCAIIFAGIGAQEEHGSAQQNKQQCDKCDKNAHQCPPPCRCWIRSRSSGLFLASSAFNPPAANTATAESNPARLAAARRSKRNQAPLVSRAISLNAVSAPGSRPS